MRGFKYFPYNRNYSAADIEQIGYQDAAAEHELGVPKLQDTSRWPSDYEMYYNRGFVSYNKD